MDWNKYKNEFSSDGSLRDLYIFDTDLSDWQRLIDLLRGGAYRTTLNVDNKVVTMPENVVEIFHQCNDTTVLMTIEVDGILINCHFFIENEIEFDIDPSEIINEEKLSLLFEFMQKIGGLLQKKVLLTPENSPEMIIFQYKPETGEIEYIPLQ